MNRDAPTDRCPSARVPLAARKRRRASAAALAAMACLAGCGGASNGSTTTAAPGSSATEASATHAALVSPGPHAVVARVGARALTGAMLEHLIGVEIGTEPAQVRVHLVPPEFKECVARLEAKAKAQAANVIGVDFRGECQKRYEEMRQETVKRWISGEWVIHGAEEAGVAVSDHAVHERYIQDIREGYKSYGEFAKYLEETDQTEADLLREIRTTLDGEHIREGIERKAADLTSAGLLAYYREHPLRFKIPQRRDLYIVRTKTKAAAEKAKQEIAAGRSFASVVDATTLGQPVHSKHGFVRELKPGLYNEPEIDQAIFRAKPDVLTGPIEVFIGGPTRTFLGWYVFEVKRIHPGRQKSFAEVASSLRKQLPEQREKEMLVAFTTRWRAKWVKKTNCSAGYVMAKCSQYKPPKGAQPEDPYTLA